MRPQSHDEKMAVAMRRVANGEFVVINLDGQEGKRALDEVMASFDLTELTGWNGSADGGDCLFSTTHAMARLVQAERAKGWKIVTGHFRQPENHTIHAWLEYGDIVVNVSNTLIRPVYAVKRDIFMSRNFCTEKIQAVTRSEAVRRIKTVPRDERGQVDLRLLTHRLLRRTRYEMKLAEEGRRHEK